MWTRKFPDFWSKIFAKTRKFSNCFSLFIWGPDRMFKANKWGKKSRDTVLLIARYGARWYQTRTATYWKIVNHLVPWRHNDLTPQILNQRIELLKIGKKKFCLFSSECVENTHVWKIFAWASTKLGQSTVFFYKYTNVFFQSFLFYKF